MAIGDFFEVRMDWTFVNGQRAEWVRYYEAVDDGSEVADAPSLAVVVGNDVEGLFETRQVPNWTPGFTSVQNLTNPADFYSRGFDYTPALVGTDLPSFCAIGIRSPKQPFGYNRSRANLPLGSSGWLGSDGSVNETGLEAMEAVAAYAGAQAVAASFGGVWNPVTVKKTYDGGVLTGVTRRQVVTGLWEINSQWTTVKSRQAYNWTAID